MTLEVQWSNHVFSIWCISFEISWLSIRYQCRNIWKISAIVNCEWSYATMCLFHVTYLSMAQPLRLWQPCVIVIGDNALHRGPVMTWLFSLLNTHTVHHTDRPHDRDRYCDISRKYPQTWDTCQSFTVVNQTEEKICTGHRIMRVILDGVKMKPGCLIIILVQQYTIQEKPMH